MGKGRILLYGQFVKREVVRFQHQGLGEIFLPALLVLPRQAVHQVQADIGKTGLPGRADGLHGFRRRVGPADSFEFLIIERLDADRQSVKTSSPQKL